MTFKMIARRVSLVPFLISQAILFSLGIFFIIKGLHLYITFFVESNKPMPIELFEPISNIIINYIKCGAISLLSFSALTIYKHVSYEKTRVIQNSVIAYIKSKKYSLNNSINS